MYIDKIYFEKEYAFENSIFTLEVWTKKFGVDIQDMSCKKYDSNNVYILEIGSLKEFKTQDIVDFLVNDLNIECCSERYFYKYN